MSGRSGVAVMLKSSSRTRFLIGAFLASLIVGVVIFVASDSILVLRTYQLHVESKKLCSGTVVLSSQDVDFAGVDPMAVEFQWESDTALRPLTAVHIEHWYVSDRSRPGRSGEALGNLDHWYVCDQSLSVLRGEAFRHLDVVTRGLTAGFLALVVGLFALFTRRVCCVLRVCYAGAPEPRPARYLALVSVLLPDREQQQWWRELCSTLAESAHRDRRKHSWSYLGSAPALILTSWCVHRSRPTQQTER